MSSVVQQPVPEGYQQTEAGVIPEDWSVAFLGHISDVKTGPFGSTLHEKDYVVDGTPIITVEHLGELGVTYQNLPMVSDFDRTRLSAYVLRKGDIAFSRVGSIDRNALIRKKEDGWLFSGRLLRVRLEGDENVPEYLSYHFHSSPFKKRVVEVAVGQTMPSLNTSILKSIKVVLPSTKEEQTAIANALSDVDALINSLEKLIAKKRAIKTAAMQQLLTGKKRLPPFDKTHTGYKKTEVGVIPEYWTLKSLKTVLKENPKYGIGAEAVPLSGKLPVYIRITDISENGYFNPSIKMGVDRDDSDQYILQSGDMVFARTGASVGKSYLYRDEDGLLVYAGFLIKISPDANKLVSSFLFQYVKTRPYWDFVTVMSMRSGQPGINGAEYGKLLVPLPPIEEQTAIAKVLFDMDSEIENFEQRLAKTRMIKQGMMQELLTGRTRLL